MLHVHFDDDPTSSAHWAVGIQAERTLVLAQISNRDGNQVRLPLVVHEAQTLAAALRLATGAGFGTTVRSRELNPDRAGRPSHWAVYACRIDRGDGLGVRVDFCRDGEFTAVVMPVDASELFAHRILETVSRFASDAA